MACCAMCKRAGKHHTTSSLPLPPTPPFPLFPCAPTLPALFTSKRTERVGWDRGLPYTFKEGSGVEDMAESQAKSFGRTAWAESLHGYKLSTQKWGPVPSPLWATGEVYMSTYPEQNKKY